MSKLHSTKEKAEQIIRQYADMIYRIAFHNLKNPADTEDIFSGGVSVTSDKDCFSV